MKIFTACATAVALLIGSAGAAVAAETPDSTTQLAQPAAAADAWGRIRTSMDQTNAKCLDADTNTAGQNPAKVQLWECNNTAQQSWRYLLFPSGYAAIQVQSSGKCLDVAPGGGNGTLVRLWDCNLNGVDPAQLWSLHNDQGFGLWYQNDLYTGRVLDADNNFPRGNGTRIQVWDFLNGANQHWW